MGSNILVITWNVNRVKEIDLTETLIKLGYDTFDIVAINLQEARGVTINLPEIKIKRINLGQIVTILISRDDLYIKNWKIGQGFMKFINKGFLITTIGELVNINVHLTHQSPEKRQKSLKELNMIIRSLGGKYIILSGDFNFRENFVESRSFLKKSSVKFLEARILFPHTYKFIKNTSEYDENRQRAYCDRIFTTAQFTTAEYNIIEDLYDSDHRAVFVCTRADKVLNYTDQKNQPIKVKTMDSVLTSIHNTTYNNPVITITSTLALIFLIIVTVRYFRR